MTVSDGDGQRQNKQYGIGFIDARDGRAEGMLSDISARTVHMRRRPGVGQTWRFIGKSDRTLIRRNSIRDAETHLSLRFPWNRGRPALSTYICATERPGGVWHQIFLEKRIERRVLF